jgi:hypothetical protein
MGDTQSTSEFHDQLSVIFRIVHPVNARNNRTYLKSDYMCVTVYQILRPYDCTPRPVERT